MSALTLRVRQLRWEAERVVSIVLDGDGRQLPEWLPGAHLGLHLPSGLVRQYSLCGDPADRTSYRVAVLAVPDGRGGSREVHEDLRVGQRLEVDPPRNQFGLEPANSYLFIAGGIGITPILPMVHEARNRDLSWRLVYGGRDAPSMAFVDELPGDERVSLVHGPVDAAAAVAANPDAVVYCCGPEPLLDAVRAACPDARFERFAVAEPDPGAGGEFGVVLSRSGRRVPVPAGQSVLDTLRDAGTDVPSSCEQGFCGTCETKVLAGRPDHRDTILTESEKQDGASMMVCVSRCLGSELTLDL